MPYIYVKLDDFDDDELIEELEDRGFDVSPTNNDNWHPEQYTIQQQLLRYADMIKMGKEIEAKKYMSEIVYFHTGQIL